jgi:hypothetical protein
MGTETGRVVLGVIVADTKGKLETPVREQGS